MSLFVDDRHCRIRISIRCSTNRADSKSLIGRWDITIDENGKPAPSWLEVKLSGHKTLVDISWAPPAARARFPK